LIQCSLNKNENQSKIKKGMIFRNHYIHFCARCYPAHDYLYQALAQEQARLAGQEQMGRRAKYESKSE
jgi:hypothetical protein